MSYQEWVIIREICPLLRCAGLAKLHGCKKAPPNQPISALRQFKAVIDSDDLRPHENRPEWNVPQKCLVATASSRKRKQGRFKTVRYGRFPLGDIKHVMSLRTGFLKPDLVAGTSRDFHRNIFNVMTTELCATKRVMSTKANPNGVKLKTLIS